MYNPSKVVSPFESIVHGNLITDTVMQDAYVDEWCRWMCNAYAGDIPVEDSGVKCLL